MDLYTPSTSINSSNKVLERRAKSKEGSQIFLDRSTNLQVSERVEVHLYTKRAKADSTKLKGHKALAKTKLSLFSKRGNADERCLRRLNL